MSLSTSPSRRWIRGLLAPAVVALATASAVTLLPNAAATASTLGAAAAQSGRYFGAAVAAGRLGDSQYTAILDREFNMMAPENEMKRDHTEPSRNNFTFGSADQIVNRVRSHNQRLRGHTLAWHSQLPGWVSAITDANTLRGVMNNHVNTVMGRYRGLQAPWNGGNNQQWRLNDIGNGQNQIINRGTGTALDSLGDRTAGSSTCLWAPNSHPNNQWRITAV